MELIKLNNIDSGETGDSALTRLKWNNSDYNLCDKRTEMEFSEIELILKRSPEMKGWGQDFKSHNISD